ncbi:tripartite tricarboxylate transporter TctB family protein [Sulfitobacter sp. D35]|uniref:tripartite tricarboxylate transporter TctB family protein n=1 Tax=Sulfitobacter sp. D35 TaxID=3083252 RepID=UPI00296E94A1|nr:tripartite tricarboxylate transporter TctB family protein [Sulfitobacter sp. D35]MDW4497215.1 tripartite tricarboxylate transporter TctB family protein [Sulfitobacter sp. D35]
MDRRPFTEIGVCLLIALISLVFLVQALALPPGTFEPLGSGPVPKWTALVVIACCLGVCVSAARYLARQPDPKAIFRDEFEGGNPASGLLMMGLTVAYVALLQSRLIGFGVLTTGYLVLLILAMERFRLRALPFALGIALIAAFGAQYVFTRVFFVDLPV